jgi:hypothetical protein
MNCGEQIRVHCQLQQSPRLQPWSNTKFNSVHSGLARTQRKMLHNSAHDLISNSAATHSDTSANILSKIHMKLPQPTSILGTTRLSVQQIQNNSQTQCFQPC